MAETKYITKVEYIDSSVDFELGNDELYFSLRMEAEYYKVEGGKETKLFSIKFWTKSYDWSVPLYDEDELCKDDIIEWFNSNSLRAGHVEEKYPELWKIDFNETYLRFYLGDKDGVPTDDIEYAIEEIWGGGKYELEIEDAWYSNSMETEIKKRIDDASQKYVEGYLDAMLSAGCSEEVIKHCYELGLSYTEDWVIYCMLDEDFQKLYTENFIKWDLESYIYQAIKKSGEQAILHLGDKEVQVDKCTTKTEPIDYKGLKKILSFQCEGVLSRDNPEINNIPIVDDLEDRTMGIFKFVHDEICCDDELNSIFSIDNIDSVVDRLVSLISKYDGINIPAPYEDIDDWWGDFNNTINYLVDNHIRTYELAYELVGL